jgi:hypothetical protein
VEANGEEEGEAFVYLGVGRRDGVRVLLFKWRVSGWRRWLLRRRVLQLLWGLRLLRRGLLRRRLLRRRLLRRGLL